jgi:hypothetical protein
MTNLRGMSLLVVSLAFQTLLSAADLTKLDRTIAKEPVYQSKKPQYCLLVFGPEAKRRVWLVLDGDALFVDANGNGDLTEPGKKLKVQTPNQDPASFEDIEITGSDGKEKHKLQVFVYKWFDYQEGKDDRAQPALTVGWTGKRSFGAWGDGQSPLKFAPSPKLAPIIHIDGPLQMGFECQQPLVKKTDGTYELSVGVGTQGLGKGSFSHLKYWENAVPESVYPSAILEFPSKTPGGDPVRVEVVLKKRC